MKTKKKHKKKPNKIIVDTQSKEADTRVRHNWKCLQSEDAATTHKNHEDTRHSTKSFLLNHNAALYNRYE